MQQIGQADPVLLTIRVGVSLVFDLAWYVDDAQQVGVHIASVASELRQTLSMPVLLNIGAYATVDGVSPWIVHVNIPATITSVLALLDAGVWDFVVTSTAGEKRALVPTSPARIVALVSVP